MKQFNKATIERFVQVYAVLLELKKMGKEVINSEELENLSGCKATSVRRDLSTLKDEKIGRQRVGYDVEKLYKLLQEILNKQYENSVFFVGKENECPVYVVATLEVACRLKQENGEYKVLPIKVMATEVIKNGAND